MKTHVLPESRGHFFVSTITWLSPEHDHFTFSENLINILRKSVSVNYFGASFDFTATSMWHVFHEGPGKRIGDILLKILNFNPVPEATKFKCSVVVYGECFEDMDLWYFFVRFFKRR